MSNVLFFGAAGDGVQDDTDAVREALLHGDGVLHFPPGNYRVTETIEVNLAKTGRFAATGSHGTSRIMMSGGGPALRLTGTHGGSADPNSFRPEVWQSQRMPQITGLEIIGDHPEADGIEVEGVVQLTLTGLLLRKLRHGIRVTGRARNVLVDGCHLFENTGIGIFLDRVNLHQVIISASHISYCRLGGVRIEDSEIRNLQITGNDIEYNNNRAHGLPGVDDVPTAEIYFDAGSRSIREVTICSNTIQATASPNGANIRMIGDPARGDHKVGMTTITGNLIGSQTNNIHLSWVRGVTITGNYIYSGHHRNLLADHCHGLVMSGNCYGHNPDYGDKEIATGVRLEHCVRCNFTGELIEDAEAGSHTVKDVNPVPRDGLVELIDCESINMSGSQIRNGTPHGVYLKDSRNVLITGCTITEDRAEPKMRSAVELAGRCENVDIHACQLSEGSAVETPQQ